MGATELWSVLVLGGVVFGPGLIGGLAWSPVLLAGRIRSLFRALPITDSVLVNFAAVNLGLYPPWIYGLTRALSFHPDRVPVILSLMGGYSIGLPVIAGLVFPRLGLDWDPANYHATTWLLLVAGSTGYALGLGIPLLVLALFRACSYTCL